MKRLLPPTARTRSGQAIVQIHEDELSRPPAPGGMLSVVAPGLTYLEANHSIAADAPNRIGAILAAKLAVAEVLIGMVAYDTEFKPMLLGERRPGPRIECSRAGQVSIDWPEAGVDAVSPKFTVRGAEDDFTFDGLGLSGPDMDEATTDVYGEGMVLLHRHDVTGTVIIETLLNTQSARDGVQLALMDRFGVEPRDFRTGRRIVLRCYYEREIRIGLAKNPFGFGADPTGEKTKANEFPLMCFLEVEVPDVILVRHPGRWLTIPRPRMP